MFAWGAAALFWFCSGHLSAQTGHLHIKKDTLLTLALSNTHVHVLKGEIYARFGKKAVWQKDSFTMDTSCFRLFSEKEEKALDAKRKALKPDWEPLTALHSNHVRLNLAPLKLAPHDTVYYLGNNGERVHKKDITGGIPDSLKVKDLPVEFRLVVPGWPVFFYHRDSFLSESAKLHQLKMADSLRRAQDSTRIIKNYLKEHNGIVLWPPNDYSIFIYLCLFLLMLASGWVGKRFFASNHQEKKAIETLNEEKKQWEKEKEQLSNDLKTAKKQIDSDKKTLSENDKSLVELKGELTILQTKMPFVLEDYTSLSNREGAVSLLLNQITMEAEAQLLKIPKSQAQGVLGKILFRHQNHLKRYKEPLARWNAVLKTLKDGNGVIVDPTALRTLKNVSGTEAQVLELRKMFFLESLQHEISATFILLEEIRILPALTDEVPDWAKQLSERAAKDIDWLLSEIRSKMGCSVKYVPLHAPAKDHIEKIDAKRVEKAQQIYLNHRLEEKTDEIVIQIDHYATDSNFIVASKEKMTKVLVTHRTMPLANQNETA